MKNCFGVALLECRTTNDSEAPNPDEKCVFPFNWNGTQYTQCTKVDFNDYWCGTRTVVQKTDGWGFCKKACTKRSESEWQFNR